jgi:hypothetical protein
MACPADSPSRTLGRPLVSPRVSGSWVHQEFFAAWLESLGRWGDLSCPLSVRGRSISVGTWVLLHHDSSSTTDLADRVIRMRFQELLFSAFVLGAAIALNNCRHALHMRGESALFQSVRLPQSN